MRETMAILMVTMLVAACGGERAADAKTPAGTVYGEGVAPDTPAAKVSELFDGADSWEGKRVRVEGLVTGVCAKRGCWFRLAGDREGESLTFKVTDGVIVFPMSMKGKYAVAEGVVRQIALDLEQTRRYLAHKAEEAGETFDPASVTEPMKTLRLDGLGAVVRDEP